MPQQPKNNATFPAQPISGRDFFAQWGLITGFWLLIFMASLLEAFLFSPNSLAYAWRPVAMQWLPWILLTPIILWLSSRFTIERSTWRRNVWVHLAACVIIVGGLGTIGYWEFVRPNWRPPPQFAGQGAWGRGPMSPGAGMPPNGPGPGPNSTSNTSASPGARPDWQDPRQGGGPPPGDGIGWGGPRPDHGHPPGDGDVWFLAHGDGGPFAMPRGGFMPMLFGWQPSVATIILSLATFQLPTFWAVLGAAHALLFYKRSKERERRGVELEARLTQARLQALRGQLNPHFLFNTLNSIASLVYEQPKAADEMIGSLSDLLRLTLNTPERQEVTLREELHFLDQYLFIEQTRFGDRLKIEKNIEPATLDTMAPILILQPLVENAFKHGIESQLGPAIVSIAAKRIGETLHLEVTDNGRGVAAVPDGNLKEGVGLSNTRARLRELYGELGVLSYGARKEGGFWVAVQIPWRTTPAFKPAPKTQVGA